MVGAKGLQPARAPRLRKCPDSTSAAPVAVPAPGAICGVVCLGATGSPVGPEALLAATGRALAEVAGK